MMNSKLKYLQIFNFAFTAIAFFVSCQHSQNLTGKWQEIENKAILEFKDDHTFIAVDDMGMAVSGTYALDNNGNVRFEFKHSVSEVEIIDAKISLQGGVLTFYYGDTREVEKYRRVKP
ncbi:MAG: hypothetical protein HY895_02630 [Deltaproteobacteria bacterium]|nr:hypothetical protein [Deltaproteobacteria bacterium]